jgi:hypothetical protein
LRIPGTTIALVAVGVTGSRLRFNLFSSICCLITGLNILTSF